MSKEAKLNRKSLRLPDPFVRRGIAFLNLLSGYRNRFLAVAAIAVVAVAVVFLYEEWTKSRLEKAWVAYHQASKQTGDARQTALRKVADEWSGTRAGFFAAVNIADHSFDDGKTAVFKKESVEKVQKSAAEAIQWYERALTFSGLTAFERQLLAVDKGAALELQNKPDLALAEYQRSVDWSNEGKPLVLLSLGRVLELKNQKDQAISHYERVVREFETTEYAKLAKSSLRRMTSKLLNASEAP